MRSLACFVRSPPRRYHHRCPSRSRYYEGCRFFRVMKNFMAQVGIHDEPASSAAWKAKPIEDDPAKGSNSE